MQDRSAQFSITKLAAILFSVVALALVGANFFSKDDDLGFLGQLLGLAGGVFWVRSFCVALSVRERNAFEAGRDVERGGVRSVR